jgi:16S rRNA (cytosine967-C5)-methyltransferase
LLKPDPRYDALQVLTRLEKGNRTLDQILETAAERGGGLSGKDQALFNALVFGILRWRGRLDWFIKHFSKTPLRRIDPGILNILRLGAFQLLYMERIPASAAVNTSVEMAKSVGAPWVVRFVNGLLRNLARGHKDVIFPDLKKDPILCLSIEKSFPQWLLKRWRKRFGMAETAALCDAINTIPPITLRTNSLRTDRTRLLHALGDDVEHAAATVYAPDGVSVRRPGKSIPDMKGFQDGWFQVQDEAAQLVSILLNPEPGDNVLDACAGLGGKTGHLSQLMKGQGRVIAMDRSRIKLDRLEAEMDRLGVGNVKTVTQDLNTGMGDDLTAAYRCVLLDAPCSGLGVLRRNPDARWSVSEKDLSACADRQIRLLNSVSDAVAKGGALVYAVCSFEPEETDAVLKTFLKHHPEFTMDKAYASYPVAVRPFIRPDGFFSTYPHLHGMDGFFAARLLRTD